MRTRFLYHAEAVAATGRVTLPFHETMEIQASVALPINGGHGSARVEHFRHRDIFSFARAESHVVGSYSDDDKAHGTLSSVVVEGVNILNVVTCDRVILRITSKHPAGGAEPSFIVLGSRFEGLRIAGHEFRPDLATDLFAKYPTWKELTQAYAKDPKVRAELDSLALYPKESGGFPKKPGTFGCTLVRNLDNLPPGLTRKDHGIYVPHFGTIYLAEFFVSPSAHRLLMLHVDLGCSVEGCYGVGSGGGNGSIWP